jgi:hypothetical protein
VISAKRRWREPRTAVGGQGSGNQQHDPRSEPFTPSREEVFGGSLKNGMTCSDQMAQVGKQCVEVGLDWLEQLSNRPHVISTVRES